MGNLAIKAYNGQIHGWEDGFVAFGIGAAAGAVATVAASAAIASLGAAAGSFGGSFLVGALSAAYSIPTQNLANHVFFGDPMMTGWDYAKSVVLAGLSSGIFTGVANELGGRNFFSGKLKAKISIDIEPIESMPISSTEANVSISDSKIATFERKMTPYEKGEIGVRRAIAEFEEGGGVFLRREVTVEVNGVRNRFDFVGEKDGVLHFFEVKNDPHAHFTKNQSINIPILKNKKSLFIPVGKNATEVDALKPFALKKAPFTGDFQVNCIHYE